MDKDVDSCNSGSAVMNSKSEIVGVVHTVLYSSKKSWTKALSMQRILELLETETKNNILELNKECSGVP